MYLSGSRAMGVGQSVYSRAILRACQLLGGPEQLAVRVGVSRLMVRALLKGFLVPPPSLFLKVVDILMAAEGYAEYDAPHHAPDVRSQSTAPAARSR
jgi:hypothetical protein